MSRRSLSAARADADNPVTAWPHQHSPLSGGSLVVLRRHAERATPTHPVTTRLFAIAASWPTGVKRVTDTVPRSGMSTSTRTAVAFQHTRRPRRASPGRAYPRQVHENSPPCGWGVRSTTSCRSNTWGCRQRLCRSSLAMSSRSCSPSALRRLPGTTGCPKAASAANGPTESYKCWPRSRLTARVPWGDLRVRLALRWHAAVTQGGTIDYAYTSWHPARAHVNAHPVQAAGQAHHRGRVSPRTDGRTTTSPTDGPLKLYVVRIRCRRAASEP